MRKENFEQENIFGLGQPNTGFAQYFIGNSYLNQLTDMQKGEFPLFNVTFEPGCASDIIGLNRAA